ncbi:MAG: DUF4065 domain-containing protein [Christensenellaceae bacterium]|nr:DUF4065 domain-containing protein [Christensenellaceae bacterium]
MRAEVIANTFLRYAFREGIVMPHRKLHKLLYFAYKDYLRRSGGALFADPFYALECGPVVMRVYEKLAQYKRDGFVTRFIEDEETGMVQVVREGGNERSLAILEVWERFKNHSADELSEITHLEGGAWHKARLRRGRGGLEVVNPSIDPDDIRAESAS